MTESYHFQIEPEPAKEALFRVGGVYRDKEGDTIRLCAENGRIGALFLNGDVWGYHGGFFDLATGICEYDWCSLIPGELIYRSGQWVTADAPATIGPFGSGASLKTDGSQITGRIEPEVIAAANLAKQIDNEVMENLRAPLPHFNQRTEFDPFPGFKVRSDTGWMTGEDGHPLQRMTADSPTHGSAHLLAKP